MEVKGQSLYDILSEFDFNFDTWMCAFNDCMIIGRNNSTYRLG